MEKFVTGMSLQFDSFKAGQAAARQAAAELGHSDAGLVLVFATSGYDQHQLLRGIRSVFTDAALSGGSVEGLITRQGSCEDSHAVALMALHSEKMDFHPFLGRDYTVDSVWCAQDILAQLPDSAVEKGGLLLLFPDGMTGDCTALLNYLNEALPPSIVILGGGTGTFFTPDPTAMGATSQYKNSEVVTNGLAGVLISGDIEVETSVSHGCEPIGLELEVTRSTGAIVQEFDGRPAWDVFKGYVPDPENGFQSKDMVYLSVGIRLPELNASDYGPYIIRSPSSINFETGAVHFAGRIEEGAKVTMVRRDPNRIRESAQTCAREIRENRPEDPLFLLHIDCAGRGQLLFGERVAEMAIDPIHQEFSDDIPLIGFHSFGEIAPLRDQAVHHNYTVALCAIYHRRS